MTLFGIGILIVGLLLCSWMIDLVLFAAGAISQKLALSYIRFSLFGAICIAVIMAFVQALN
jgi:hypothetical protein